LTAKLPIMYRQFRHVYDELQPEAVVRSPLSEWELTVSRDRPFRFRQPAGFSTAAPAECRIAISFSGQEQISRRRADLRYLLGPVGRGGVRSRGAAPELTRLPW
jgi:hypothetical protein